MAGGLPPELVDETRRALDAVVSMALPAERWNVVGNAFAGIDSAVVAHDARGVHYWLSVLETATPGGRSAWRTSDPVTDPGIRLPVEPGTPTEFHPTPGVAPNIGTAMPNSPAYGYGGAASYSPRESEPASPIMFGPRPAYSSPPMAAPPPMPVGGTRRSPRLGALIAGVAACGAVFATAVVTLGASDRVGAPSDDQTPAGGAAWVVPVLIGGLAVLAAVALAAIVLQRRHQRPPAPGPAPPISPLIHQIEPPRNLPAPWHIIDYKNRMVFNLNASGG